MKYPIVIHKDTGSEYGVTVPDLPGCHSAGSTMNEAIMGATEAIECHIEGLLADGEEVPPAMPADTHQLKTEYMNAGWLTKH